MQKTHQYTLAARLLSQANPVDCAGLGAEPDFDVRISSHKAGMNCRSLFAANWTLHL
jgi:hypothetical protein